MPRFRQEADSIVTLPDAEYEVRQSSSSNTTPDSLHSVVRDYALSLKSGNVLVMSKDESATAAMATLQLFEKSKRDMDLILDTIR